MPVFDIIVVGAGPAGSTAARRCAGHGLRTLLLEKERLPRFKPCGGGVTAAAVSELDFKLPDSIVERRSCGIRVIFRKIMREIRYPRTVAYMVTRSVFDEYLAHMAVDAGASLHDRETCLSVSTGEKGVKVQTDRDEYRCSLVIGADGFFSRVRKGMIGGFPSDETRFCVMAEIPLPAGEIESRFGDLAVIHYGYVPSGYAWIFPKGEYLSAGLGGAFSHSKALPARFRSFLRFNNLPEDVPITGCFIPVSRWENRVYGERTVLTGDAAGFVDSFSGEGIRFAIISGKIAAETAVEAHARGRFSAEFLRNYQDRCDSAMGDDLKRSNHATDLLFRHMRLLLGTVVQSEEALTGYLKTVTGEWHFGYFVSWLKRRMPAHLIKRLLTQH